MPPTKKTAEAPPPTPPAVEEPKPAEKAAKKAAPVARAGGWVDYGDGWVPEQEES